MATTSKSSETVSDTTATDATTTPVEKSESLFAAIRDSSEVKTVLAIAKPVAWITGLVVAPEVTIVAYAANKVRDSILANEQATANL